MKIKTLPLAKPGRHPMSSRLIDWRLAMVALMALLLMSSSSVKTTDKTAPDEPGRLEGSNDLIMFEQKAAFGGANGDDHDDASSSMSSDSWLEEEPETSESSTSFGGVQDDGSPTSMSSSSSGGEESPIVAKFMKRSDPNKWPRELAKICNDHDLVPIIFQSTDELRQLLTIYESSNGNQKCKDKYAEAFEAMRRIVGFDESHLADICSYQVYYNIRQFHLKFIHYYKPELTADDIDKLKEIFNHSMPLKPVPRTLRTFFILFAKQVNNICKIQLVDNLIRLVLAPKLIKDKEFDLLKEFSRNKDRLYKFAELGFSRIATDTTRDYTKLEAIDLNIVDEVDYLAKNESAQGDTKLASSTRLDEGEKLYLLVRFDDSLRNLGVACERRFRPIYEALFLPVIRLNGLGYADRLHSKVRDRMLKQKPEFTKWYKIIQTCELLRDVEILHDASSMAAMVSLFQKRSHRTNKAKLNRVELLSKQEADAIKLGNENPDVMSHYEPEMLKFEMNRAGDSRMMWVRELDKVKFELASFNRDLRRLIKRKASHLRLLAQQIKFALKVFISTNKRGFVEKDDKTTSGRLSAFLTRHQAPIKVVAIMLFAVVLGVHFGG